MEDIEVVNTFQRENGNWISDAICMDGRYVCGVGITENEAKEKAIKLAREHNIFLASDPKDRLKEILERYPAPNQLLSSDITQAIRAIAEILLVEEEK